MTMSMLYKIKMRFLSKFFPKKYYEVLVLQAMQRKTKSLNNAIDALLALSNTLDVYNDRQSSNSSSRKDSEMDGKEKSEV